MDAPDSNDILGGSYTQVMNQRTPMSKSVDAYFRTKICGDQRILLESGFVVGVLSPEESVSDFVLISATRLSLEIMTMTNILSPLAKVSTPSPSSSTVPAPSTPRTAGHSLTRTLYARIFQSAGFRAAARTFTRSSPEPGFGMLFVSTFQGPLGALSTTRAFCDMAKDVRRRLRIEDMPYS